MARFRVTGLSLMGDGKAYVFVSQLDKDLFALSESPKLSDVPIESWLDQPRTVEPQDYGAFVFVLRDATMKTRFKIGDEVELS